MWKLVRTLRRESGCITRARVVTDDQCLMTIQDNIESQVPEGYATT